MYNRKIVDKKEIYLYVLFLIPVFIVQVTELVKFIIDVRKFHFFSVHFTFHQTP